MNCIHTFSLTSKAVYYIVYVPQWNIQSCVLHCFRSLMEPPKLCTALFTFPHETYKDVYYIVYVPP